eukprot:gene10363-21620_t
MSKSGEGVVEVSRLSFTPVLPDGVHRNLADAGKTVSRVSFEIKLAGEHFGAKESLNENMKTYLSRSMSAGVFVSKLIKVARAQKADNLQGVNFARFVDIQVLHETKLNQAMSSVASVIIVVGALIGITFGVLVYQGVRKTDGYVHVALPTSDNTLPSVVPHLASIHDQTVAMGRLEKRAPVDL